MNLYWAWVLGIGDWVLGKGESEFLCPVPFVRVEASSFPQNLFPFLHSKHHQYSLGGEKLGETRTQRVQVREGKVSSKSRENDY